MLLRGDHQLNVIKAAKLPGVADPVKFASEEQVRLATGCGPGAIGPIGLEVPIVADLATLQMADFVCGANAEDKHLIGVNWGRDLPLPEPVDLRNVVEGDPSPDGNGSLRIARGIEVGHIFQLGTDYSESMHAVCLDERGNALNMLMGCYGIGVSRVVAAAIEQSNDERGIIWPTAIAPFHVALLPLNMHKSQRLRDAVEALYEDLCSAGIEVLFDDRSVRPGVMFAETELIGVPHRLVLSERHLDNGQIEYKARGDADRIDLPLNDAVNHLKQRITSELEFA